MKKTRDLFRINQIKIARQVMKESPIFSELIGGMTKREAKKILRENNKGVYHAL